MRATTEGVTEAQWGAADKSRRESRESRGEKRQERQRCRAGKNGGKY